MASEPHKIIRNDNLRLVLSAQEGDYIRESRRKMRRQALLKSIFAVLCAVMICSDLSLYRYKNMKREHNDFLAGYGRKHSD
jgi:hypothetical protein